MHRAEENARRVAIKTKTLARGASLKERPRLRVLDPLLHFSTTPVGPRVEKRTWLRLDRGLLPSFKLWPRI